MSVRLVRIMGPTGAVASLAGALLSRGAPDRLLVAIFAAFALLNVPLLLQPERDPDRAVDDLHVNVPLAIGISIVVGFFGGMVGIAAIAFIIASLIYMLHVPVRIAIDTSLGIGMFSAAAALIGKAATAQIEPLLTAIVFADALVSSPLGAAVSVRTRPHVLMLLLAAIVTLAGLRMAWQALVEMAQPFSRCGRYDRTYVRAHVGDVGVGRSGGTHECDWDARVPDMRRAEAA